jgi:hypothetical protein
MAGELGAILPGGLRKDLTEAERKLLHAAAAGEQADCEPESESEGDSAYDPANADSWGRDREIRAALIRWLCINPEAAKKIDPRGIDVYGAKITDGLNLSYVTLPFPLRLSTCRIMDNCDLRHIKVPVLDLDGSATKAIKADGADVRGNVFLSNGFSAQGEVRLSNAQIGGDLDCDYGHFNGLGEDALDVDSTKIGGTFFLRNASTEGSLRLLGASIGSNIECDGGTFKNPGGRALFADKAEIKGHVILRDGFTVEGLVDFTGAHIEGGLQTIGCRDKKPLVLRLNDVSVGFLGDEEESWPEKGNLYLDGFVYGRIAMGPTDALARLRWLDRAEFAPQPYRQLAKVLREMGDDEGAKQVLFELERRARAADRARLVHAPARWLVSLAEDKLYDATVGYGIYPGRAVWYLGGLTALGWLVHWRANRMGAMAPTEKDAYAEFRKSGRAPDYYTPFNPLIYSLENCVPLVKFGQDDHWQPDPNPPQRASVATSAAGRWVKLKSALAGLGDRISSPVALRWFRWTMIALGWLLATFFVAGISGIIKTN